MRAVESKGTLASVRASNPRSDMGARKMGIVMVAVAVMVATLAAPALAGEADTALRPAATEPNTGQVVRPAADQVDRPPVTDEPVTDERPLVRDRCEANPRPDRCPDRPDQVNIRQLIWRLIKAGEWRMLFHLLNRLGII